jgi:uroporphyrinogen-III synthase
MRLLVTRPQPDADRSAEVLRRRGHIVIVAPVLEVEIIANAAWGEGPYAAVVMTSASAARAISRHERRDELAGLAVFTVGRTTAAAARAAGFATVASADGGAAELVRLIAAELGRSGARLLYLAAEQRATDLAAALQPYGLGVETVVIYRTIANPVLVQELRAALSDRLDGVLHYSRRSAQTFLAGARDAGCIEAAVGCTHYCLSGEVAAPLRAAGATAIKVAAMPDEAALMALL